MMVSIRRSPVIVVVVLALSLPGCRSSQPCDKALNINEMHLFGTMGKEGKLFADREVTLLEHTGAGCLTHMWFGGNWPGYDRTRIRVYVDGEQEASIDMELFLGHGIGWTDAAAPWGTRRIGKTGHPSGLYNNYQIPFGRGIRVAAQLGSGVRGPQTFWWITRGVENLPVRMAGLTLPKAARLRLYRREEVKLHPLETLELCDVSGAGLIYNVTLSVASGNYNYLEACLRAYADMRDEPIWLSSGTEDYFLGTYYFNRGRYALPTAGLTHMDPEEGGNHRFSAYRFHEEDLIIFQKGLRLVWRNGEELDGHRFGDPQASEVTSYVWVYEW